MLKFLHNIAAPLLLLLLGKKNLYKPTIILCNVVFLFSSGIIKILALTKLMLPLRIFNNVFFRMTEQEIGSPISRVESNGKFV